MGIKLFQLLPGAPAVFQCTRLLAAITTQSCGAFHAQARYDPCVECRIGADHARKYGLQQAMRRTVRKSNDTSPAPLIKLRCVRCERPARRLIGPHLCVSCANRHAEALSGTNSKGSRPNEVAAGLYRVTALIEGPVNTEVGASVLAPTIKRVRGGALVDMIAAGRAEVERWLAVAQPGAHLVDAEIGLSLAEAYGWPPSPRHRRRRAARGRVAAPCEVS